MTPAMWAAYRTFNMFPIRLIVQSGSDLNAREHLSGNTALHIATQERNYAALRELLLGGADVSIRNKQQETPIDIARNMRNQRLISLFFGFTATLFQSLHYGVAAAILLIIFILSQFIVRFEMHTLPSSLIPIGVCVAEPICMLITCIFCIFWDVLLFALVRTMVVTDHLPYHYFNSWRITTKVLYNISAAVFSVKNTIILIFRYRKLPYLDCSTWDELIEERYIGKLCGYPLCSATLLSKSTQKYHIDKKIRRLAVNFSCYLHTLLCTYILSYSVCDINIYYYYYYYYYYYCYTLLYLVEKDDSTDEDIGDEEKHEILWENENDGSSKSVKRLFFHSTESTVHFPSSEKAYELGKYSTEQAINSEINNTEKNLPDHQQSRKLKLTKDETCKLKRLSKKYSKISHVKRPAIIEIPLIYARKAQETTMDNELQSNESYLMLSQNQSDVHTVATLFSGWLTERSRDLVRLGRRQPVGEMNIIWKKFFMGEAFSEDDENNILLPDIDLVDVKKKQLSILLQATKPTLFPEEVLQLKKKEIFVLRFSDMLYYLLTCTINVKRLLKALRSLLFTY
uniref:RTR1-type domain-containing protein n=1 Tax=Heterorhabditis bacteriophora TaxID=37862 RepID=A0A1I7WA40_HETBA